MSFAFHTQVLDFLLTATTTIAMSLFRSPSQNSFYVPLQLLCDPHINRQKITVAFVYIIHSETDFDKSLRIFEATGLLIKEFWKVSQFGWLPNDEHILLSATPQQGYADCD